MAASLFAVLAAVAVAAAGATWPRTLWVVDMSGSDQQEWVNGSGRGDGCVVNAHDWAIRCFGHCVLLYHQGVMPRSLAIQCSTALIAASV